MLRETVLAAAIAGLIAAIALTAMQAVWITPLILQAETFEEGGAATSGGGAHEHGAAESLTARTVTTVGSSAHGTMHEHRQVGDGPSTGDESIAAHTSTMAASIEHGTVAEHNYAGDGPSTGGESTAAHTHTTGDSAHHPHSGEWKPHDGFQRTAFTFAANLLMGVGYAFLLTAVYLLWREPRNVGWGALYGAAGFLVFFAAPSLGLPPELPGTAAAELTLRQQWWVLTAAATGGGLLLLFSRTAVWRRALGAALIVAPHLIPAPSPEMHSSLAPESLQTQFLWATAICNAVFWVLLGLASTFTLKKLVR